MSEEKVTNQSFYTIKVVLDGRSVRFIAYSDYSNVYTLAEDWAHAKQFNRKEDAEAVIHFHQGLAAFHSITSRVEYLLRKDDLKITETTVAAKDYLEGHGVELPEEE